MWRDSWQMVYDYVYDTQLRAQTCTAVDLAGNSNHNCHQRLEQLERGLTKSTVEIYDVVSLFQEDADGNV